MTATPWMDIAWKEVGVQEVAGPGNAPEVLAYFRDVGREEITSDVTPWCAAFAGACLARAGVEIQVPKAQRLMAQGFLSQGTPIDAPRVGAICVIRRGSEPWMGHVGFVTGHSDTHVMLLGGNQSNQVCVQAFPRADVIGFRWPVPPATAGALKASGSRTVSTATSQKTSAALAGGAVATGEVATQAPPDPAMWLETAKAQRGLVDSAADFGMWCWAKWPWIAAIVAIYFAVRMAWQAGLIQRLRLDDHNTGANVARATVAVPQRAEGEA